MFGSSHTITVECGTCVMEKKSLMQIAIVQLKTYQVLLFSENPLCLYASLGLIHSAKPIDMYIHQSPDNG